MGWAASPLLPAYGQMSSLLTLPACLNYLEVGYLESERGRQHSALPTEWQSEEEGQFE